MDANLALNPMDDGLTITIHIFKDYSHSAKSRRNSNNMLYAVFLLHLPVSDPYHNFVILFAKDDRNQ
jgi:hypothetical protein